MGFIFFLLSWTPLVPCGLRTQFCCICSFFDYQEESSIYCAKLPWSETKFGFFHTDLLWLCPQCPLIKGSLVIGDSMRLNLKGWKQGKKEHNVSSSVYIDLKNRALSLHSFVEQAWVNAEQVMTVLFGLIIWHFENILQYTAVRYLLFQKWCVSLSISVVLSRLAYEILLVGFKLNISKPPRGSLLPGRFLLIMNYHICRTIRIWCLRLIEMKIALTTEGNETKESSRGQCCF